MRDALAASIPGSLTEVMCSSGTLILTPDERPRSRGAALEGGMGQVPAYSKDFPPPAAPSPIRPEVLRTLRSRTRRVHKPGVTWTTDSGDAPPTAAGRRRGPGDGCDFAGDGPPAARRGRQRRHGGGARRHGGAPGGGAPRGRRAGGAPGGTEGAPGGTEGAPEKRRQLAARERAPRGSASCTGRARREASRTTEAPRVTTRVVVFAPDHDNPPVITNITRNSTDGDMPWAPMHRDKGRSS